MIGLCPYVLQKCGTVWTPRLWEQMQGSLPPTQKLGRATKMNRRDGRPQVAMQC